MEQLPDPPKYTRPDNQGDPPIVVDVGSRKRDFATPPDPIKDLFEWLDENLGSESYGAPRVFDLFTLLAVTLAFALMFASLRLIEPLLTDSIESVAMAIGTFTTLIAIAQLAMWGGNKPRIASVVAGPPIWLLIALGFLATDFRALVNPANLFGLACSSVLGIPAGYLGGAVVAGVFLLADLFRNRFMSETSTATHHQDDEAIWGDSASQRRPPNDESTQDDEPGGLD